MNKSLSWNTFKNIWQQLKFFNWNIFGLECHVCFRGTAQLFFRFCFFFFFLQVFYKTLSIVPSRFHWLSIYSRVYMLIPSPNLSFLNLLSTLVTVSLFPMSLNLFFLNKFFCTILYIPHISDMTFLFVWLFHLHNDF